MENLTKENMLECKKKSKRRSSILKEVELKPKNKEDEAYKAEKEDRRRSFRKRVSFADTNSIKEFLASRDAKTEWNSTYEEPMIVDSIEVHSSTTVNCTNSFKSTTSYTANEKDASTANTILDRSGQLADNQSNDSDEEGSGVDFLSNILGLKIGSSNKENTYNGLITKQLTEADMPCSSKTCDLKYESKLNIENNQMELTKCSDEITCLSFKKTEIEVKEFSKRNSQFKVSDDSSSANKTQLNDLDMDVTAWYEMGNSISSKVTTTALDRTTIISNAMELTMLNTLSDTAKDVDYSYFENEDETNVQQLLDSDCHLQSPEALNFAYQLGLKPINMNATKIDEIDVSIKQTDEDQQKLEPSLLCVNNNAKYFKESSEISKTYSNPIVSSEQSNQQLEMTCQVKDIVSSEQTNQQMEMTCHEVKDIVSSEQTNQQMEMTCQVRDIVSSEQSNQQMEMTCQIRDIVSSEQTNQQMEMTCHEVKDIVSSEQSNQQMEMTCQVKDIVSSEQSNQQMEMTCQVKDIVSFEQTNQQMEMTCQVRDIVSSEQTNQQMEMTSQVKDIVSSEQTNQQMEMTCQVKDIVSSEQSNQQMEMTCQVKDIVSSEQTNQQMEMTCQVRDIVSSEQTNQQMEMTCQVKDIVSFEQSNQQMEMTCQVKDIVSSEQSNQQMEMTSQVKDIVSSEQTNQQMEMTCQVKDIVSSEQSNQQMEMTSQVKDIVSSEQTNQQMEMTCQVKDIVSSEQTNQQMEMTCQVKDIVSSEQSNQQMEMTCHEVKDIVSSEQTNQQMEMTCQVKDTSIVSSEQTNRVKDIVNSEQCLVKSEYPETAIRTIEICPDKSEIKIISVNADQTLNVGKLEKSNALTNSILTDELNSEHVPKNMNDRSKLIQSNLSKICLAENDHEICELKTSGPISPCVGSPFSLNDEVFENSCQGFSVLDSDFVAKPMDGLLTAPITNRENLDISVSLVCNDPSYLPLKEDLTDFVVIETKTCQPRRKSILADKSIKKQRPDLDKSVKFSDSLLRNEDSICKYNDKLNATTELNSSNISSKKSPNKRLSDSAHPEEPLAKFLTVEKPHLKKSVSSNVSLDLLSDSCLSENSLLNLDQSYEKTEGNLLRDMDYDLIADESCLSEADSFLQNSPIKAQASLESLRHKREELLAGISSSKALLIDIHSPIEVSESCQEVKQLNSLHQDSYFNIDTNNDSCSEVNILEECKSFFKFGLLDNFEADLMASIKSAYQNPGTGMADESTISADKCKYCSSWHLKKRKHFSISQKVVFDVESFKDECLILRLKNTNLRLHLNLTLHESHQIIVGANWKPQCHELIKPHARLAMSIMGNGINSQVKKIVSLRLCQIKVELDRIVLAYNNMMSVLTNLYIIQGSNATRFTDNSLTVYFLNTKAHILASVHLEMQKPSNESVYPGIYSTCRVHFGSLRQKTLEDAVARLEGKPEVLKIVNTIDNIVKRMQ